MSIVLWPRQEVLQLVIPELGSVGRHLNANTANNLIRRLTKLQTPEGKISFDRWLVVAKEVLRWNDHCIHLFWDMVSLSTYYLSRDSSLTVKRQDVSLDLEYVAIFLVLHLHEPTASPQAGSHTPHGKTPVSPTVAYEDVWPTAPAPGSPTEIDGDSPSSPSKDPNRQRKMSPMAGMSGVTPMSPRSPKANHSPSHKRGAQATSSGAKTPRSNAQFLHSVRQKIPLILRSLSIDQQDEGTMTDLTLSIDNPGNPRNGGADSSGGTLYSSMNHTVDFAISKKTVDALGLIVCGGYSRDQAVPSLSSLFPSLNGNASESDHVMRTSKETFDENDASSTIPFSELSAWINIHMSMNDTLYPVSVSPSYGSIPCSPTTREIPHISAMSASEADASKEGASAINKGQFPSRTISPVSSLSRSKPTIINGCSTTVVNVIGGALMSTKNSFRRHKSMSHDKSDFSSSNHEIKIPGGAIRNEHVLSDSDSDKTSPVGRQRNHSNLSDYSMDEHGGMDDWARYTEDIEVLMRNNTSYLSRPEQMLPPLYLNLCTKAKMYLISPYHSASITGCSDCEIVIGAVFGAVILSGCERVNITCACRKLIILNCVDCVFNVATLTTTIIAGDCSGNTIGPYNTSYKNLRNHLKLAALEPLLSTEEPSANPVIPAALSAAAASVDGENARSDAFPTAGVGIGAGAGTGAAGGFAAASPNCWASLCDVNACLEAPTTNSNPSGYAVDAMDDACPLLPPLPSTARLLPYENFHATTIPFKQEVVPFEQCAIRTPSEYLDVLKEQKETLAQINAQMSSALAASVGNSPPTGANADEWKRKHAIASTAVSKKFMEWLVATGNAKQVLDLIRLDSDKTGYSNATHQS